ncbi:MAG: right-handed parallel beta-helix repeat-containing protein [Candidatus Polarisedimenticolia bacterium]
MARVRRKGARILLVAAAILGSPFPLLAQTPTNLRVDGVADNQHVVGRTPTFCWDFPTPQENWQLQVDDDASFTADARHEGAPQAGVWFWDSGSQNKGAAGPRRCAAMRQITKPGTVSLSLDLRPSPIHWRVRVQSHGSWGPWANASLRVNQAPLRPASLEIASEPRSGSAPALPPAETGAGRTWHVSPSGDDQAAGDESAPFRTLAHAVAALAAGDTLLVHGGVYEESVVISTLSGHASGSPGREIVVKAHPGEAPVLRAPSSGSRVGLQIGHDSRLSGWIFDGLTIGGASTHAGLVIGGARHITVRNCRWEGSLGPAAVGVMVEEGSREIRITGCRFDQAMRSQVEISGATDVEVDGNEFSGFEDGHALLARGGAAGLSITGNTFRDAAARNAAVELAGTGAGARVWRNVFARLGGTGASAVRAYRSGGLIVENNVFHALQGAAVQVNEQAPFGQYRNNIFSSCGTGLRFAGAATSIAGSVVDFNLFFSNGQDVEWGGASQALLDHAPADNCLGTQGGSCDPMFVHADSGDFRLRAGSPAIDAGDPFAGIPSGGGARLDIGRHELGSQEVPGLPYEQQTQFSIADGTPRIAWKLEDLDGDDGQARYQVQIDTRPTFDGTRGEPLIDSGMVTSSEEQYIVPADRELAPGEYYVRVRQWDRHAPSPGIWSGPALRFRVTDGGAVRLAGAWPAPGSLIVDGATPIRAYLESGTGALDPARASLFVNGMPVEADVAGGAGTLSLTWTPTEPFSPGSRVTVRVVASRAGEEGRALDAAYTYFVTGALPQAPTGLRVSR